MKQLRLNCTQLDTISPSDTPCPTPVAMTPHSSPVNQRRFGTPKPSPQKQQTTQQQQLQLPTSVSEFNFGRPKSTVLPAAASIPSAPSSPMALHKSSSMSNIDYESAIYALLSQQDPFYDRTPWFSVIGR